MYKLIKDLLTQQVNSVQRIADGATIPFDEANTDYQAYLKWVAESPDNQPLPAENT